MTGYVGANLGMLPGATQASAAVACATDGSITVGGSYDSGGAVQAVWWDAANVIHLLPADGVPTQFNLAFNCSDTGLKIVGAISGSSHPGLNYVPAVWTSPFSSAPAILTFPGQGVTAFNALIAACSIDATYCVGWKQLGGSPTVFIPLVWSSGLAATLPLVSGYDAGVANDISSLGDVIVGYCYKSATGDAIPVRWQGGPSFWTVSVMGGTIALGAGLSALNSLTSACSSNGSLAAGITSDPPNTLASEWLGTALQLIGGSLGGAGSAAYGCNADGVIIVGSSAADGASYWVSLAGHTLPLPSGLLSVEAAHGASSDGGILVGGPRDIFAASAGAPAVKWTWTGPGPGPEPSAVLNLDNLVVNSLASESPCTVAQYAMPPPAGLPAAGLRWSDTRGLDWGNAVPQGLSADPESQLQWNRTGYARDRVFELFWSAALKTALNGAFIMIEPWKS